MENIHSNINNTNSRCEYKIVKNNENLSNNNWMNKIPPDCRQKIAFMQIFTFIILQAWRRKAKQIKQLLHSVEDLKQSNMRTKTELIVYSNLIRTEQQRNDDLTSQLRNTTDSLKQITTACEIMSSNMKSMKTNKILLEQELKLRYEEYDALQEILSQKKTDLFRSMMNQRHLQSQLCQEQRIIQSLKSQKYTLINEICNLNTEHRKIEENLLKQLEDKDFDIKDTRCKLEELQAILVGMQKNQIYMTEDRNDIQFPKLQVSTSKENLNDSFGHRLGLFWTKLLNSQISTLKNIHCMCYYLLPAMPPPTSTAITS